MVSAPVYLISPKTSTRWLLKHSSTKGPVVWRLDVGHDAWLSVRDYILICRWQTDNSKSQLYLYRLNPEWWSTVQIDPLLLKARLLDYGMISVQTFGGSCFFLSPKGFAWSITITLIHISWGPAVEARRHAMQRQMLLFYLFAEWCSRMLHYVLTLR